MPNLLLTLLASASYVQAYDELLAKHLTLIADAAYCGDSSHGGTEPIESWSCAPCQAFSAAGMKISNVKLFGNSSRQTLGFTAVADAGHQKAPSLVVAFRGSVLTKNYADDADETLIADPRGRKGRLHRGFYNSYASMSTEMLDQVRELRSLQADASNVLVTGHSLGAAQAVLGADDIAAEHSDMTVMLYSFGTPRSGDLQHAQRLKSTSNLESWAVAHRADTVPQCGIFDAPCNEVGNGLHQVSHEVWYPEDLGVAGPAGYIMCDTSGEDPKCQDSLDRKLLNWDDHNLYLNHTMYCCDGGDHGTSGHGCQYPFMSRDVFAVTNTEVL